MNIPLDIYIRSCNLTYIKDIGRSLLLIEVRFSLNAMMDRLNNIYVTILLFLFEDNVLKKR